jgi:hypothetical protein
MRVEKGRIRKGGRHFIRKLTPIEAHRCTKRVCFQGEGIKTGSKCGSGIGFTFSRGMQRKKMPKENRMKEQTGMNRDFPLSAKHERGSPKESCHWQQ